MILWPCSRGCGSTVLGFSHPCDACQPAPPPAVEPPCTRCGQPLGGRDRVATVDGERHATCPAVEASGDACDHAYCYCCCQHDEATSAAHARGLADAAEDAKRLREALTRIATLAHDHELAATGPFASCPTCIAARALAGAKTGER